MKNLKAISFVGLGKLGLPLAAIFAKNKISTIGVDINPSIIRSINKGESLIIENGLDDLLSEVGGKALVATDDYDYAISQSNLTYILTATPSNPDGSFSNDQIESALKSASKALKKSNNNEHTFVISSTVMPGSIEQSFIPLIEKYSNRKLGEGFHIAYCPDFAAIGDIINGFTNPEFVLIGQSSEKAGLVVEEIHHTITENNPEIRKMSLASAEIAKVSLNAYVTMKISFANNLANICEKIPGANIDDITSSIGLDKRVSPYYIKGGMSFGGTCFPRDTYAFNRLSKDKEISTELFDAVTKINNYQDQHLAEIIISEMKRYNKKNIVILGTAFKKGTPVVEESVGVKLLKNLLSNNLKKKILVVDPLGLASTKKIFKEEILYSDSASKAIHDSDIIILINSEKEFIQALNNFNPTYPVTIVDCWRVLEKKIQNENIKLIRIGEYY